MRWLLIAVVLLSGCSQKSTEPVEHRAKTRSLPIQKRDMVPEQYTIARENLDKPISIAGDFPKARDCANSSSYACEKFWFYVETTAQLFIHCMEFQSSEETPRRCLQLYDVDGDFLVTLADYHYFQAFHDFRWTQLQGD